jgi:glycosyltransferase involved in cell wall biosynthesis
MPEPTISVAMCTYNSVRYVREQLDSFVNQTRPPDELVICDDASTDGTGDIVAAFARTAPFEVRTLIQPRNVGGIANFEAAISLCNREVIFLSDADDVWLPRKIESMAKALHEAPDAAGVLSDAAIVNAELRPLGRSVWERCELTPALRKRMRTGNAFTPLLRSEIVQGCALAFRASHRSFLLPLATLWGHDSWIGVLLAAKGELLFVDEQLMLYREHGANLIGAMRPEPPWLRRLAQKFGAPREHYWKALQIVHYFLKQMDELEQRLGREPATSLSPSLLAAIARRRRKLNRRRRKVETILMLLGSGSATVGPLGDNR